MKKIMLAIALMWSSLSVLANDPNQSVLDAFAKEYPNVKEVKWTEQNDNYEASFKQNEINFKVVFDRDGNVMKTYKYYGESSLPASILKKLKSKYSGKSVHGVTEVSSYDEGTNYIIMLEDAKEWVEVKATDFGSLTVQRKFKKS